MRFPFQRIRKQMFDLTGADYRATPLWQFCLDEESREGQDETTVRPSALKDVPARSCGLFLIAADVVFADWSKHLGYLFSEEDNVIQALGAVFIKDKPFLFRVWGETEDKLREHVEEQYQELGLASNAVFPASFRSVIPIGGQPFSFELDGFIINGGPNHGKRTR